MAVPAPLAPASGVPTVPVPALGARVPMRHGPAGRAFGRFVLRVLGWKVTGALPDAPKFVAIAAPHTSNWDGLTGLAAKLAVGIDISFYAKAEAFVPPLSWVLRWLGVRPLRRDRPGGVVRQAQHSFATEEQFVFGVTPEGTRRKVERWRTGFHRIARAAGVPVVLASFDYANREIRCGPTVWLTDDLDADMAAIRAFYKEVQGKNPEWGA